MKNKGYVKRIFAVATAFVLLTLSLVMVISANETYQVINRPIELDIKDGDVLYPTLWYDNNGLRYYYNSFAVEEEKNIVYQQGIVFEFTDTMDMNGNGKADWRAVFKNMYYDDGGNLRVQYDPQKNINYWGLVVSVIVYDIGDYELTSSDIGVVEHTYVNEAQTTSIIYGIKFTSAVMESVSYRISVGFRDSQGEILDKYYDTDGILSSEVSGNTSITDYLIYGLERNRTFYLGESFYLNTWEDRNDLGKRIYYNILQRSSEQIKDSNSMIPIVLTPNQNGMVFEKIGVTDYSQSGDIANDLFLLYMIYYDELQYEPLNKKVYDEVYVYVWFHDIDEQGLTIDDFGHMENLANPEAKGLHSISIRKACQLDCTIEYQFFDGDVGFSMFTESVITYVERGDGDETDTPSTTVPPSNTPSDDIGLSFYGFINAIVKAPLTFINEALSFDVFGINVLNAVRVLITAVIVYWIVSFVLGNKE